MNQPGSAFSLDRLFREQVALTPDAVALIDDEGSVTFAELEAASDRLAGLIRASNVPNGAFVGVHMERSARYVASVLGVLKANAAVVPLPPSFPAERLREILSFAALDAIIVDHGVRSDPPLHDRVLLYSDAAAAPAFRDVSESNPDRPAFVLCSSGSTGKPKMIVRSHRSFFHRLRWTWSVHPYEAGEVCCQKAQMMTTHAVYELFEPLLRGIPVCIISDREAKTFESFWETIQRRGISRLLIVPSVLQASLDMPEFSAPDIKVLVLMGEYVHPALARRTIAAFPQSTRIYSIYGSTEASSTLVCDLRESIERNGELPLGEPISPDVRAYLLDDKLDAVDAGSKGMLYIAGTALFTEYFRDPALTDAVFVTLRNGERIYRTNDQVLRTPDGALQYLGRTDHVVKIRGYRVDLQEVENAIAQYPDLGHFAVIATDDSDGNAMLVAFVSPASVPTAAVYRLLREHLPDYMVPSRVIAMDALPLTASGKVDRRKLAESSQTSVQATPSSSRRLESQTERTLADVWKDVLGHDVFDVDSNFFEVGGTSLKTFAVISRAERAFGLERHRLADNSIYRLPTIEGLAAYIDSVREGRADVMVPDESALVTLKSSRDASAAPLFLISSAGGTLGAYEKLVRALATPREIIGVRDAFLWGKRDPTLGFQSWVSLYLDAIRKRQPKGPYYIVAYSSAGAFGYEIARQLRCIGEEVGLLALIDPLAIDSSDKRRYGHWAFNARFMRPQIASIIRIGGSLRPTRGRRKSTESSRANDFAFTRQQFLELEAELRANRKHILQLSALLELNTGLPIAFTPQELAELEPGRYFDALLARMETLVPDVDKEMLGRLVVQYQLQVRSQHQYRLQWFDGALVLFDPAGPYNGLLAALFRPYVDRLLVRKAALGTPTDRVRELGRLFSNSLRSHFLSMRDDAYVQTVARELDKLL